MVCSHIVAIIRYISMRDTKSSKSFGVRDWGGGGGSAWRMQTTCQRLIRHRFSREHLCWGVNLFNYKKELEKRIFKNQMFLLIRTCINAFAFFVFLYCHSLFLYDVSLRINEKWDTYCINGFPYTNARFLTQNTHDDYVNTFPKLAL